MNFWKCAQENGRFLDLLEKIVARRAELVSAKEFARAEGDIESKAAT